jgi:hypothetical protein
MPTYSVTHPTTGKIIKITGATAPTEAEIDDIFSKTGGGLPNIPKEGIGTFLKSTAEATGIPKSLANIGALGSTLVGAGAMAINKPEFAQKSFDTALNLRKYAGTEGSFDQGVGSGLKTIGSGAIEAGKTYLTARGLKNPTAVAKVGLPSAVIGGGLSKITGGTFSEGAGAGLGSAPSVVAGGELAGKVFNKAVESSPLLQKLSQAKGTDKFNLGKAWSELATDAAKGKAFDSTKYIDELTLQANKFTGKDKVNFLKLVQEEAINPIVGDSEAALAVRRNIKPASFLKKIMLGESTKNKFDVSKYTALNTQLKQIPEVAKYDKYISRLSKVTKVSKNVFYGMILNQIFGGKGAAVVGGLTGQ